VASGPEVYGVIHADSTPDNILVSGEEFMLIDVDDFGEGWRLSRSPRISFLPPHVRADLG
jgi:hypothetical protein